MSDLLNNEAIHSEKIAETTSFLNTWERLSQVVTVLQLERPSDWSIYQATSVLTIDELRRTMNLRMEFSTDAVNAVCQTMENCNNNNVENGN